MEIKELIKELEKIRLIYGDDCEIETFSESLSVYDNEDNYLTEIEIF